MSVWLPHAALIPIYWNRAWPVRLPYPSSFVSTPAPITFGGFGLSAKWYALSKVPGPASSRTASRQSTQRLIFDNPLLSGGVPSKGYRYCGGELEERTGASLKQLPGGI